MNLFLTLTYLFFIGSTLGWGLELFFRRFLSRANPKRKWINPGFCVGPYLPLYGSGLCILYLFAALNDRFGSGDVLNRVLLILTMAVSMTVIEYLAGVITLSVAHVRLWDYSKEWGNVQGLICPKFSLAWAGLSAVYYFTVHPYILNALNWLSENLAFSFVIGFFFGIFTIDVAYSAHLVSKIKAFAVENEVTVRYELLKAHIREAQEQAMEKTHFLFSFASVHPLNEHLGNAFKNFGRRP